MVLYLHLIPSFLNRKESDMQRVSFRAVLTVLVFAVVANSAMLYGGEELRLAAREGKLAEVKKLVEGGTNINAVYGDNSWTAVMEAAEEGHNEIVQYLLSKGADPNIVNKAKWTALMYAADQEYAEVAASLIAGKADVNIKNIGGNNALLYAVAKKNAAIVEQLLKAKASPDNQGEYYKEKGWTALIEACKQGDEKTTALLLTYKADPNLVNAKGFSPLMWASNRGLLATVKTLIAKGAALNHQNKSKQTALMQAAFKGQTAVAKYLLAQGADKELKNFMNATALDTAIRKKHTEIIKLLQ